MADINLWTASKFVERNGRWNASRDPHEVNPGSRILADLLISEYCTLIARYSSGSLVDIGCGKAPLLGLYSLYSSSVTTVDWSLSPHSSANVDILADLNKTLPIDSLSFDTAISTDVIEHVWNHKSLWAETHRVLRPGGHLILGTPFQYWLHEEPFDYFRWTPFSLKAACHEVGLEPLSVTPIGGAPEVLADITGKLISSRSTKIGSKVASALQAGLRLGPIDRISRSTSHKMTLAHVLVARKQ